jgi:hypothetical protein
MMAIARSIPIPAHKYDPMRTVMQYERRSCARISCLTAFGVPFIMFTQHKHAAETMTAAWLLPIVPI